MEQLNRFSLFKRIDPDLQLFLSLQFLLLSIIVVLPASRQDLYWELVVIALAFFKRLLRF